MTQTDNPFVPGDGLAPPFLAGRESEQAILNTYLSYLDGGRSAPSNVILTGPRGNGKTALLRWFEQGIKAGRNQPDVVWLTADDILTLDTLATEAVPPGRFEKFIPDQVKVAVAGNEFGWDLGDRSGSFTKLLAARCQKQPLVVLLDEAHTLPGDVGRALLNASQKVRAEAPFLLVMAGTPDLPDHLNTMSATFWDRAEQVGVGRLDTAAAAAALVKPLNEAGISLEGAALDSVVEDSQRYPYFLQLWGAALWATARTEGAARIDDAVVARAGAQVNRKRTDYYRHRYGEFKDKSLLDVAARVADAFAGMETMREHELDAVIAAALPPGSEAAQTNRGRKLLGKLGYVWNPPGADDTWQPGIPSLMTYMQGRYATETGRTP